MENEIKKDEGLETLPEDKVVQKIDTLEVRGFSKKTLAKWEEQYGKPVDAEKKQIGYMSVCPVDREILNVQLGQIIDIIRADLEDALQMPVIITPGVADSVGMTGTLRAKLGGLVNAKVETEPQGPGDVVSLERKGDLIEIRLKEKIN